MERGRALLDVGLDGLDAETLALIEQRGISDPLDGPRAFTPNAYYTEDFDDGVADGWSLTGLWHVSEACYIAATPRKYLSFNHDHGGFGSCDYDHGLVQGCASFTVDLTPHPRASLSWLHRWQVESFNSARYDVMTVEAKAASAPAWSLLYSEDSSGLNERRLWLSESADLSPFTGEAVAIRFCFDSRDSIANHFEGWFLDSVVVYVDNAVPPGRWTSYQQPFEYDPSGWSTTGLWHKSASCGQPPTTPPHYLGYHQAAACNFDVGTTSGTFTFKAHTVDWVQAELSFDQFWEVESWFNGRYDRMSIDISTDGGATWAEQIYYVDAKQPGSGVWLTTVIPLKPAYLDQWDLAFRFKFDSVDGLFNGFPGWHIDQVRVTGTR